MQSLNSVSKMSGPSKMYVCPNCDDFGCGDYIFDKKCPLCGYPLFSNDFIYMPDFRDAYDIARLRSMQNKRKKLGFDEDDSGGSV